MNVKIHVLGSRIDLEGKEATILIIALILVIVVSSMYAIQVQKKYEASLAETIAQQKKTQELQLQAEQNQQLYRQQLEQYQQQLDTWEKKYGEK